MRRMLSAIVMVLGAVLALGAQSKSARPATTPAAAPRPMFNVVEAGIPELQEALKSGRVTSRELVLLYMARIAYYEDALNAVMTVSRTALDEADVLDRERRAGKLRGPLHGVPIALKDNIHTTNMPTTGGALAFKGFVPPYEATLTTLLKDAGAIILAKTVMTELANWVAGSPTPMPANYSAFGGYGMNPYDPRPDPRPGSNDGRPVISTGGSSSGIGTAVSFWAANVGTETSGSILSPSNQNMLVGIKPTVGRVSRYGVIPITADQDTPGPMARTVMDAAIMLGAMEGATPDPHDPATSACAPPPGRDYTKFLDPGALAGARIGIPRASFYEDFTPPGAKRPATGISKEMAAQMAEAIEVLKKAGAVIVDPADIPSVVAKSADDNYLNWRVCGGIDQRKGRDAGCSVVFKYGMKRDFNAWLATLGEAAPVKSLTDLRYFNLANAGRNAIKYGQSLLDISDEMDVVADKARYEADRRKDLRLAGAEGIDAIMKKERLDALLFPSGSGASIAARPGYPTVIVPYGRLGDWSTIGTPRAADAEPGPAPFGVSFTGTACSEPRLIGLAYAFEQLTKRRVPPPLFP